MNDEQIIEKGNLLIEKVADLYEAEKDVQTAYRNLHIAGVPNTNLQMISKEKVEVRSKALYEMLDLAIEIIHGTAEELLRIDAEELSAVPDRIADLGRAITYAAEAGLPLTNRTLLLEENFESLLVNYRDNVKKNKNVDIEEVPTTYATKLEALDEVEEV